MGNITSTATRIYQGLLGLAVIEAMMVGLPVAGLATTEMVTVIRDGHSGILHTDTTHLMRGMRQLLEDPAYAARLGQEGRKIVMDRFNIDRFTRDWHRLLGECRNTFIG